MKKITPLISRLFKTLSYLSYISAFIAILAMNTIRVSDNSSNVYDILGFQVPTPPLWTGNIPFVGMMIGTIWENISLHGLATIGILVVLLGVGYLFSVISEKLEKRVASKK